jgi:hypothetical protein
VSLNDDLLTAPSSDFMPPGSAAGQGAVVAAVNPFVISCPGCAGDIDVSEADTDWQSCPYCQKQMQIRVWPIVRQNSNAAAALPDQATCFFHPDKAFQACCQRCGRFVCALCDLQLGAEHVCPACFERGRGEAGADASKGEWRYRDVFYDSIALAVGWGWILFWPTWVAALPAVIFLHVKYRKAPRSYLLPRSGWRFWMAYLGLVWLALFFAVTLLPNLLRRH